MKLISVKFLIFLLLIDLSFIFLSFIHHQFDLSLNDFLVYNDGGYAEKFQYLKFIGIVMISFLIAIKRKSVPFRWKDLVDPKNKKMGFIDLGNHILVAGIILLGIFIITNA